MPQVALLKVEGLVNSSNTILIIPADARQNSKEAYVPKKSTKIFCEIVVASRNSSFIKDKGFISFIIMVLSYT